MSDTPRTDKERYSGDIIGLAGTLERELAVVDAQLGQCKQMLAARDAEMARDAQRLMYVCRMVDGIGGIDLHEEAAINASALGREEPNDDDYLAAVRTAIDAALAQTKEPG